jgi:hypothetical protein
MEYFTRLRQKFMSLSRDNFLPETFTLFENLSEMSLKDAKSRETREIIAGFREDVFNEKKIVLK